MINYHKELVSALNNILPTHYEMALTSNTKIPCISYMELNNASTASGNTREFSRITYQVKVWSNKIGDLQTYAIEIDKALRPLGFTRISSGELYDRNSTMMEKILTYEATALEIFN